MLLIPEVFWRLINNIINNSLRNPQILCLDGLMHIGEPIISHINIWSCCENQQLDVHGEAKLYSMQLLKQ